MQAQVQSNEQAAVVRDEILVVKPDEDRFQVFAPADPDKLYHVGGSPEDPQCTCPEYRWRQPGNGDGGCVHISAVLKHLGFDVPEKSMSQERGKPEPLERPLPSAASADNGNSGTIGAPLSVMSIKRSISPDGKINSLSVEFSLPVAGLRPQEVCDFAGRALSCQDDIVNQFMEAHSGGDDGAGGNGQNGGNTVPATLKDIGGMQTRWGWRYYINVETKNGTYKLFGNRRELAEQLSSAGHGRLGSQINKGKALNVSCLAVLEESEDGRYTNVVELRPAAQQAQRGR